MAALTVGPRQRAGSWVGVAVVWMFALAVQDSASLWHPSGPSAVGFMGALAATAREHESTGAASDSASVRSGWSWGRKSKLPEKKPLKQEEKEEDPHEIVCVARQPLLSC